jgi:hypothetical protein
MILLCVPISLTPLLEHAYCTSQDGIVQLEAKDGIFTSNSPSTYYSSPSNCTWVIENPYGGIVYVYFARLNFGSGDYLAISRLLPLLRIFFELK